MSVNRISPPSGMQRTNFYPPRLRVEFPFIDRSPDQIGSVLAQRLEQSPQVALLGPVEVWVEGQTAILRGEGASESSAENRRTLCPTWRVGCGERPLSTDARQFIDTPRIFVSRHARGAPLNRRSTTANPSLRRAHRCFASASMQGHSYRAGGTLCRFTFEARSQIPSPQGFATVAAGFSPPQAFAK